MQRRKPLVDMEEGWTAGWRTRRLRELVKEPAFHGLVTLGRLSNMLHYIYSVMASLKGRGPEVRRQRNGSFYFSGVLLLEAEVTIKGVARYFRDESEYRTLLKAVNSDSFVKVASRFRTLRNRAMFHINQEDMDKSLETLVEREHMLKTPFIAFMTAYGLANKDKYYDLSDRSAMELIVGADGYGEWLGEWFGLNRQVLHDVYDALEKFIATQMAAWDVELRITENDQPDDIENTRAIRRARKLTQ